MNNFSVYYKMDNGNFRILNNQTFSTDLRQPYDGCKFELFKGYEANDESLVRYKEDLIKWNDELKNNNILNINYLNYYNHFLAVELTFKRLAKGKFEHFDKVDSIESDWIDSCYNSGLMFFKEKGTYDCYGYDYSSFYPYIQSQYNFKFPDKKGSEQYIKVLQDTLQLGYYKVKITSSNPNSKKVFSFSKHHTYTNISLEFAIENKEQFDFNIELIIDDKPNCYLYDSFVRGSSVFGNWFLKLYKLKLKFPKNKLIKHLLSSLWGTLCRSNNIRKTWTEIETENIKICKEKGAKYKIIEFNIYEDKEYYLLKDLENPYVNNIRIKSFLTSYGRNKVAELAKHNIENVIRIQTDGVVFDKEIKINDPLLIAEFKTTGSIKFDNLNSYSKI